MANIRLELHPWRTFHGGDIIRGTVKIDFLSNIQLQNIQVKLIGVAQTHYSQSTGQSTIEHDEKHDIVHDVHTIFPPPNLDGVLTSSTYTLPEGKTLESQFNFTLPFTCHCGDPSSRMSSNFNQSAREQSMASSDHNKDRLKASKHLQNCYLPPSFHSRATSKDAKVFYLIKVTIRKSKTFSLNIRKEFPLEVSIPPPDPFPIDDQVLVVSDMLNLKKNRDGSARHSLTSMFKSSSSKLELRFCIALLRSRFIVAGQQVKLRVLILSDTSPYEYLDDSKDGKGSVSNELGVVYMKYAELKLESIADYRAESMKSKIKKKEELLEIKSPTRIDLANMVPIEDVPGAWMLGGYALKYGLDISDHFEELTFPRVKPTFQVCNIDYKHYLKLRIAMCSSVNGFTSSKADLEHHCVVVGGFPRREEIEKLPEYTE